MNYRTFYLCTIFLFYNLFIQIDGFAQVPDEERDALISLFNACDGENWNTNTSWNSIQDVSTWFGVSVVDNHVTYLSLFYNGLVGEIPPEIGDLAYLETLNLAGNSLSGVIPIEIGNLVNLVDLRLDFNALTGSIPSEIGGCTALSNLNLAMNQLDGDIPSEIWDLSSLTILLLAINSLTGTLPTSFSTLESIQQLNLNANQLDGFIPEDIGDMTTLFYLGLGGNLLEGEIPTGIGGLTNLQTLNLFGNNLSGEIPSEIGDLTNLISLDLQLNQFSGSLPLELGNLTSLTELRLQGNLLSGSLPTELGNLSSLTYLGLISNNFDGEIPSELSNLTNLTELRLEMNSFTGALPDAIATISTLSYIGLSNNQFDALPDFSAFENSDLNMDNNKFTFEDIEPQLSMEYLTYSPQAIIDGVDPITLNVGEELSIQIPVGGSANTYQWYKDGDLVDGQTTDHLFIENTNATDAGYYYLEITNSLATELTLSTQEIIVDIITSIKDHSNVNSINTYPNPVRDILNLVLPNTAQNELQLTVVDLTGRVHYSSFITYQDQFIDVSFLPSGIYLIKLFGDDGEWLSKFVKSK